MNFYNFILLLVVILRSKSVEPFYYYGKTYVSPYRAQPAPPKTPIVNTRPIIGILSHEIGSSLIKCLTNDQISTYKSYISAAYVKYIESAGARVVPIRIGQPYDYYESMANSLNGVLLPGGGAIFTANKGYADAARIFYKFGITNNLPIWGTCLGFEIILVLGARKDMRWKCHVKNVAKSLKFRSDYKKSKLFRNAPMDIINILETQPVTFNTHSFCINVKNLTELNVTKDWQILTTTTEGNHSFVSAVESRTHPIWGVQFHPEKNCFEWSKSNIVHTKNAVKIAQYFANFFVNEARNNSNSFPSYKKEMQALIYNYKPIYAAKMGCQIEQCYLLK